MTRASSMPSNAIADEANGSLILRGVKVDVNSDVGHQFAIDCVRFVEGLVTEAQLRKKYALDSAEGARDPHGRSRQGEGRGSVR